MPISFGFGDQKNDGRQKRRADERYRIASGRSQSVDFGSPGKWLALHNHFFYEEPRIFYMHVHGMGDVPTLAKSYAAAIKDNKLFPANQPAAGSSPARTAKEIFDLPALDKIVGYTGAINGTTYKYTIGRAVQTIMAMGAEMTPNIGLNSWAAFAGSPDAAHVAGDIAMLEPEVNSVIRALRSNNLEVVAVHHHMLADTPKIIFLHYYGRRSVSLVKSTVL